MCEYSYYDEGRRTYGYNIPGYAQGAYFPGEEPGLRCDIDDEPCDPKECPLMEGKEKKDGYNHNQSLVTARAF